MIRNEEIYRDLLRSGVVTQAKEGDDREWRHADHHWDFYFHEDEWTHHDEMRHADMPARHLDDNPGEPKPHGDSSLPPGGHGDRGGQHLDETIPHKDLVWHWDDPPEHGDRLRHYDSHDDTPFEGHWDEKAEHLDI